LRVRSLSRGGPRVHCRCPANRVPPRTGFKTREETEHASTCHLMPYSSRPYLPVEVGSGAAMCPTAPDPTYQRRWAPTLPRVIWLQTPSPCEVGSDAATCPMAPDPVSRPGRFPVLPHVPRFPMGHGLRYIKKGLAGLPMQLGSRVSKAHVHVP
jgi:hypothetical protein